MTVSQPIAIQIGAGSQLVASGAGRIVFTSLVETSGVSAASFTLFDGNPATLRYLTDYTIDANGSTREAWPEHGIPFAGDLWIGNTAGVARFVCHVVPEDLWARWRAEYWAGLEQYVLQGGGS